MSNALYKTITTTVIPGQPAVTGSPGSDGQAARTEFIDFDTIESAIFLLGLFGSTGLPPVFGPFQQAPIGDSLGVGTGTIPLFNTVSMTLGPHPRIRIDYPFIPASPPISGQDAIPDQVVIDQHIGWNASANSIDSTLLVAPARPYYMQIVIPNSTRGAMVGAREFGGARVINGFEMIGGVLAFIANGARAAEAVSHADGDTLRMVSADDLTEFYVNGTLALRADTNFPPTPGNMLGILYLGGDYVFDPVLGLVTLGTAASAPMDASGGVAGTESGGRATFFPMTVSSHSTAPANFLPMTAAGGNAGQFNGLATFLPMTVDAGGFNTTAHPALQGGIAAFQPLRALGQSIIARVSGSATFERMAAIGSTGPYSLGLATFPPPTAFGIGFHEGPNQGYLRANASAAATLDPRAIAVIAFSADLTIAAALVGTSVGQAQMLAAMLIDDTQLVYTVADALFTNLVVIGGNTPLFNEPGTVWVVNAETSASSTYAGFSFNSYAKVGNQFFGLKADGLYRLDAQTDDWGPVVGTIDFGLRHFGATEKMRVEDVYIGMSAVGTMYLRVTADDKTYTYRSNRSNDHLEVQRIKPGKGIKANWLGFQLLNAEDADFELKTVQFNAVKLTRRI